MTICTTLLLHAHIALEDGWQGQIVERLKCCDQLFHVEAGGDDLDEIRIKIHPSGQDVIIKRRAQQRASLALRRPCAFTALLYMSICYLFKTPLYSGEGEEIAVNKVNRDLPHFAGGTDDEFAQVLDAAAVLGLILPRLKPKAGTSNGLFSFKTQNNSAQEIV